MERIEQAFLNHSQAARSLLDSQVPRGDGLTAEERRALKKEQDGAGAADASDGGAMSDDLMGSMDPDLFGGRRHRYRPDQEADDDEEPAARDGDDVVEVVDPDAWQEEDSSEDEGREQWETEAPAAALEEAAEGEGEAAEAAAGPCEEEDPLEAEPGSIGEAWPAPDEAGTAWAGSDESIEVSSSPDAMDLSDIAGIEFDTEPVSSETVSWESPSEVDSVPPYEPYVPSAALQEEEAVAAARPADAEVTPEVPPVVAEAPAGPDEAAPAPPIAAEPVSLPVPVDPAVMGAVPAAPAPVVVPPAPRLEPRRRPPRYPAPTTSLPSDVASVLQGMVEMRAGPEVADRVLRTLAGFGPRLLTQVWKAGGRVLVTSEPVSVAVPSVAARGTHGYDGVAAGYFAADRLCYLHAGRIDDGDEFGDVVVLTFASAVDHAMGDEGFASRRAPAVRASYQACADSTPGHSFVDGYCAASPQHYFAQAVDAWMSQPGRALLPEDAQPDVYCTRSLLYDLDRNLYSYMDYLLRDVTPGV